MAVPIRDIKFDEIGIPQLDDTLRQDGLSGGGGGIGNQLPNLLPDNDIVNTGGGVRTNTISNLFIFDIKSNQSTFTTLVNGESVSSNKRIRISREELAKEDKRIEIRKSGYNTNEYYIIQMIDDNVPIIDNPLFDRPLGINTKDIVLTKYSNDEIVESTQFIQNKTTIELDFELTQTIINDDNVSQITKYSATFLISGIPSSVSVLKNNKAEFFPKVGSTKYEDIDGTKFNVRSSNLNSYRISNIKIEYLGNQKEIKAEANESLEYDFELDSNYTITITTEEIFKGSVGLNPKIELVKTDSRTYNINSEAGVPLMFKKNKDVQAITIIVGDDVLEFDDLDKGDLCGITIPHSVFSNIGKYNVKIFPFSFDEYENQIRPSEPSDIIEAKKVNVKFDIEEEVRLPDVDLSDRFNPYKPVTNIGSGGGGSSVSDILLDEQRDESINPFTNRGDFVNRNVDNRNFR